MTTRDDLIAEDDQRAPQQTWMRRHWKLLAAAGVVAAFAVGAGVASLTSTGGDDRERMYLELVRDNVFPGADQGQLLDIGYGICDLYDEGYTWIEVIAVLTDTLDGNDAGALNVYATGTLCPEHLDKSPNR